MTLIQANSTELLNDIANLRALLAAKAKLIDDLSRQIAKLERINAKLIEALRAKGGK